LWREATFREERYAAVLLTQARAYRDFQALGVEPSMSSEPFFGDSAHYLPGGRFHV
jgi:hypothetical protein